MDFVIPRKREREKEEQRGHARTYARKVETEFHIWSALSKSGCRHIQAMFAMADTYIESNLRVRNVAFCRAFSTHIHTRTHTHIRPRGKWRDRKGVREYPVVGSERAPRNRPSTVNKYLRGGFTQLSSFPIGIARPRSRDFSWAIQRARMRVSTIISVAESNGD